MTPSLPRTCSTTELQQRRRTYSSRPGNLTLNPILRSSDKHITIISRTASHMSRNCPVHRAIHTHTSAKPGKQRAKLNLALYDIRNPTVNKKFTKNFSTALPHGESGPDNLALHWLLIDCKSKHYQKKLVKRTKIQKKTHSVPIFRQAFRTSRWVNNVYESGFAGSRMDIIHRTPKNICAYGQIPPRAGPGTT